MLQNRAGRLVLRLFVADRPLQTKSGQLSFRVIFGHSLDLDHHGGDIIRPASFSSQVDKFLGRRLSIVVGNDVSDFLIFDLVGEAIGAQDDNIAWLDGPGKNIYQDIWTVTHGAGNNVTVNVFTGLLRSQKTGLDLLVDPGMILGDLFELSIANEIGATIAHIGHQELVLLDDCCHQGGAHARLLEVGRGLGVYLGVGGSEGPFQTTGQVGVGIRIVPSE